MSTHRKPVDLREVLHLAWPVMIARLSMTGMTFADTLFVGRLGTSALAAMGLASVACFVVLAGGQGLLGGVRVLTAHRTGALDADGAARLAWQGLWLALALAPLAMSLTLTSAPLLVLLGVTAEGMPHALGYLDTRLAGAPLELALVAMSCWFQGRGDTRTPMVAAVGANLLNVALDPLFIFGWGALPAMGVGGAALATSLSSGLGLAWLLARARPSLPADASPNRDELRRILRVGAPMALHFTLDVASFLVFVGLLARVGEAAVAAHVIAIRVVSLSFLPGYALGEAAGVLVGQRLGAGEPEQARRAWQLCMGTGLAIMGLWAVVFVLAPGPLVAVFGPAPEVAEVAVGLLFVAAVFQLVDAVAMVGLQALQGAGDTAYTMALGLAAAWTVKLPLGWALALPLGMGAAGAWWGITAELVVLSAAALLRLQGEAWTRALEPQPAK